MIKGITSETVINIINKISKSKRKQVKEVTLNMAGSMNLIVKKCFPMATRVIDRFHERIMKLIWAQHRIVLTEP